MLSDGVTLTTLAAVLEVEPPDRDATVTSVQHDSRQVEEGSLFVAIVGSQHDGHAAVGDAVAAGATAALVQHRVAVDVAQLVVADTRTALAVVAAEVYGHPAQRLSLIGVTGTNGKTTVTHMLESITQAAGLIPGIVGTLGARIDDRPVQLERTTPEASTMQQLLANMVDAGVEIAAVEVSSHAMELGRVDAIEFDVVAFTNLSQDHLDFHEDMESYYAAKAALFTPVRARNAVVYVDDPWGARLASETNLPVTTVGWTSNCDVWVSEADQADDSTRFTLHVGPDTAQITMPIPGRFNVANALVAAASAFAVGVGVEAVARGLADLDPVAGRFEVVSGPVPVTVIVDYAHSPDAIGAVVDEMRHLAKGRVIVVVGAAGDRDRLKRPLMGRAASTADVVLLTSDNPRSEDPAVILSEMLQGIDDATTATVISELDRRRAIHDAIEMARAGDAVMILGKGHEQGQEFAEGRIEPFDDRVVAREAMQAAGAA